MTHATIVVPMLAESFHEALLGASGLLALLLFVTIQLVILPRPLRRTALAPLFLLVAALAIIGLRSLLPRDHEVDELLAYLAFFLILVGIGRSGFVILLKHFWPRLHKPLPKIFLDIIQTLIYTTALILTLGVAGVQPLSLLTGSALATAIVGLSLRDTLGNLFAGLALQMQEPFEVGDWIQFDGESGHIGRVVEINWRATTIITLDDVEITVPNSTLGQGFITNFTKPKRWSRRSIYVHAPYATPPQRVQRIILDALADAWGVLAEPAPSVVTSAFDERGVQYWVRIFTTEFDKRDRVDGEVRDRIWYALQRAGIQIPPPARNVTLTGRIAAPVQVTDDLKRREEALRGVDIFRVLSDENLHLLARLAQSRLHAAGETIIRQGDPGEELFIIQKGRVAVRRDPGNESGHTVTHLGPGTFFGEMSLMTGASRSATVTTLVECELVLVDKAAFRQILESSPDLAELICECIAERQAHQSLLDDRARDPSSQEQVTDSRRGQLLRRIREFFAH